MRVAHTHSHTHTYTHTDDLGVALGELSAAPKDPGFGVAMSLAGEGTPAGEEVATAAPVAGSATSSEWLPVVDPSSGRVYYVNSVTHETSWTATVE